MRLLVPIILLTISDRCSAQQQLSPAEFLGIIVAMSLGFSIVVYCTSAVIGHLCHAHCVDLGKDSDIRPGENPTPAATRTPNPSSADSNTPMLFTAALVKVLEHPQALPGENGVVLANGNPG